MNITEISEKTLKNLHKLIKEKLAIEDTQKIEEKEYCIREYDDWKNWADELEVELTKREIEYEPIKW